MRYLVASKSQGFFLGTHTNRMLSIFYGSENEEKIYLVFASKNIFGIRGAVSFSSEDDARYYADKYIANSCDDLVVLPISSNEKHVDVIDLIKAGYGEYTHDMMDNVPMISEKLH